MEGLIWDSEGVLRGLAGISSFLQDAVCLFALAEVSRCCFSVLCFLVREFGGEEESEVGLMAPFVDAGRLGLLVLYNDAAFRFLV